MPTPIKVRQPRYSTNDVLVGVWKLPAGGYFDVEIEYGSYKGVYQVKKSDVARIKSEPMTTKNGRVVQMLPIPLDVMQRK